MPTPDVLPGCSSGYPRLNHKGRAAQAGLCVGTCHCLVCRRRGAAGEEEAGEQDGLQDSAMMQLEDGEYRQTHISARRPALLLSQLPLRVRD